LILKPSGGEDEPVDPKEDEAANEVSNDCGDPFVHRGKPQKDEGQDGGAQLPTDEIEAISLKIYVYDRPS
jgi:hypothetical protein